eukprot:scaffold72645_cov14-Tisochrysis_lutea.AAC.1
MVSVSLHGNHHLAAHWSAHPSKPDTKIWFTNCGHNQAKHKGSASKVQAAWILSACMAVTTWQPTDLHLFKPDTDKGPNLGSMVSVSLHGHCRLTVRWFR